MSDEPKDPYGLKKIGEASKTLSEILRDACGIVIDPLKKLTTGAADRFNEKKVVIQKFEIERLELVERSKTRLLETEIRRQENLESIAQQANEILPENATPENLNIDWLHIALDYCKDISEKELQKVWAQILAAEAETVGSVSRKTLDVIKNFSKQDCDLFLDMAKYFIPIENEGKGYAIIMSNVIDDYDTILTLGYLGIVNTDKTLNFYIHSLTETSLNAKKYHIINEMPESIAFSIYNVSRTGVELLYALKIKQDENYFIDFLDEAKSKGAIIKEI